MAETVEESDMEGISTRGKKESIIIAASFAVKTKALQQSKINV